YVCVGVACVPDDIYKSDTLLLNKDISLPHNMRACARTHERTHISTHTHTHTHTHKHTYTYTHTHTHTQICSHTCLMVRVSRSFLSRARVMSSAVRSRRIAQIGATPRY